MFSHIKEYMQAVTNIWGVAEGENHKKRATALQEELHTHPIKKGVTVRKSYATRQELQRRIRIPATHFQWIPAAAGYSFHGIGGCGIWWTSGEPPLCLAQASQLCCLLVCASLFSSTFSLFVPGIKTASSRKCKPIAKDWIPTVAADNFSLCMPLRPPEALSVR